jgi:rRNA maturation protein Nop10
MRVSSIYSTYCLCGALIETTLKTGTCGKCGKDFRMEWPAQEPGKEDKHESS